MKFLPAVRVRPHTRFCPHVEVCEDRCLMSNVSAGSPSSPFPENKQNEPALAVDPHQPSVLAAGANDEIDMKWDVNSSTFVTPGVGVSGTYFSFDGGNTWTQPTYSGWSTRTDTLQVGPGSIGTLPWYYENGLVSGGDPALAFGPRPGANGTFSWDNGSRLYYCLSAHLGLNISDFPSHLL
jgi:hypothetical protein